MGQQCSTLKVSAHLGWWASVTVPIASPSICPTADAREAGICWVAKKDSATPVRVDILAGETLIARCEILLADLLAGLKINRIGHHSALFFSLKAGDAEGGAGRAQDKTPVAVFYSRRLLDESRTTKEDKQEPAKTEQHASLLPPGWQDKHQPAPPS
ncbi:hypothetical protein E2C01_069877 [Portunus trituberculatus]|uniref:Uncharacterized protein n=1 Tax=Portunus trituberculatus TaxID=210409 RepID=A0A5B7I217_PORTR|nr:hypothetical protein [Portunus trituberculatus]